MNTFTIARNKANPNVSPKDIEPINPDASYGTCPNCGINLQNIMSYSCNKTGCPTGLGSKVTM